MSAKNTQQNSLSLMEGFQCEKRLWLKLYTPELEVEVRVATQMSFDEGNEVGDLAREHFGKGELITNEYWDYDGATNATENLCCVQRNSFQLISQPL